MTGAAPLEGGGSADPTDGTLPLYYCWDPATDPALAAGYRRGSKATMAGKAACRADLLTRVGFDPSDERAVIGMIGRLDGQLGELVPELKAELKKHGREDIMIVVGGVVPPQDYDALYKSGAEAIFPPGTVIAEAAGSLLKTLGERLGHKTEAAE